jgi:hypothetical protein
MQDQGRGKGQGNGQDEGQNFRGLTVKSGGRDSRTSLPHTQNSSHEGSNTNTPNDDGLGRNPSSNITTSNSLLVSLFEATDPIGSR